ncbi:MAG TPA: protease pro-enzyme activation domain-containing protein [Ktedonobacterales bacterium]|jgi:kumamolisin
MNSAFLRKAFLTLALVALTILGLSASTWYNSVSTTQGMVTIAGTLPQGISQAQVVGDTSASQQLQLSISLPLRNATALKAMQRDMYDPSSPAYHQFLTPAQFNQWFAPTQATVDRVTAWLKQQGLQVGSVASNHLLVDASGSVAQVERAFQVQIKNYNLNGRSFYAPDRNPLLPTNLSDAIQGVNGLDNMATWHPLLQPHIAATGPGGGFTPSELRTAYDFNGIISNGDQGDGQTVAIFELDGYKASDVTTYESNYGLTGGTFSNILVDGATGSAGAGAIEVVLDMEVVFAVAPHVTERIYEGPNSTTGVNDTYNRIVTDNVAKVMSTSWGLCEASSGNTELQTLDNIFTAGATQGISFFAASGDSGAYDCNTTSLAVDSPADDPNVSGVGGTFLTVGAGGTYISESAWNCSTCTGRGPKGEGGGGGLSTFFSKPSWQIGPGTTNSFSNGKRQVPDISADADPNSGYSVFCTTTASGCSAANGWISVGGTSAAAPLWAGAAADINQYLTGLGQSRLGFANPTWYLLACNSQTFTPFHDVTSGNNLFYPTTAGYDQASGVGTPDVWNIARDLGAGISSTCGGGTGNDFSISANPTSLTIAQGSNGTSTISTAVTSGTAGTVSLTASVSPTGPTAALNPTSVTAGGSSTLTVTVGATVATGTYTVTVTGTEGTAVHSTSVTVNVTTSGGGGSQLIVNGGFENGQTPWVESSSGGFQIIDPTRPHTGAESAFLCGYNRCNDQIWQAVTLPGTITHVTLTFWWYMSTSERGTTCFDFFRVRVRTSTGATISTPFSKCNANANNGWQQVTIDLTTTLQSRAGQTIQIYFQGTTDSSLITSVFVDDVTLNVS